MTDYHFVAGDTDNKYPGIAGWGTRNANITIQTGMMTNYLEDIEHYAGNWGSQALHK